MAVEAAGIMIFFASDTLFTSNFKPHIFPQNGGSCGNIYGNVLGLPKT